MILISLGGCEDAVDKGADKILKGIELDRGIIHEQGDRRESGAAAPEAHISVKDGSIFL